jgi:hypothetical protein
MTSTCSPFIGAGSAAKLGLPVRRLDAEDMNAIADLDRLDGRIGPDPSFADF